MTKTNKITTPMDLNAAAVDCLQEGNIASAIESLMMATRYIRSHLVESSGAAEDLYRPTSDLVQQQPSLVAVTPSVLDCSDALSRSGTDLGWSQHNLFSFYPRAIKLTAARPDSRNDYSPTTLVVVLYNGALANHLRATSCCGYESEDFRVSVCNALQLYKSALAIISNQWGADEFEDLLCLVLAVVNNLGHLHSHMMNFSETKECLELMVRLINYPLHSGEGGVGEDMESEFEFFCNSIGAFINGPELTNSPAA